MAAPARIARDAYAGKHTVLSPKAPFAARTWTAGELAAHAAEGVVWESFGHVRGREGFGRSRYVANADGSIVCYDSEGQRVITHPADRALRILVKL